MTSSLPPVLGEGNRDGYSPADIPDGYITWEEHYETWAGFHLKFPSGGSAEYIANRGGFTYSQLKEFMGHAPKSWIPRDLERHAAFASKMMGVGDDIPDEPEPSPSVLRSHIWFVGDEKPICKYPAAVPDQPFNFDDHDAAHCSACLKKLHVWVAGWINHGRQ